MAAVVIGKSSWPTLRVSHATRPGHTYIQIDAPLENILTMYDTADSYRSWRY